jgi:hypothetical protein
MATCVVHLYNPDFDEESLEIIGESGGRAQLLRTMMLGTATAKANPFVYIPSRLILFGVHDCCHSWKTTAPVLAAYTRPRHLDKSVQGEEPRSARSREFLHF